MNYRLAVVSAAWRRPKLTRLVLGYYRSLSVPGLDISHFVAVSEPVRYKGWRTTLCPNRPLGRKWNMAFASAAASDPDGYLTVGSDDLIEPAFFEFVAAEGPHYDWVAPRSLYLYETGTRRCVELRPAAPGAGVFFSRHAMTLMAGRPYRDADEVNIDAYPARVVPLIDPRRRLWTSRFAVVDIKDGSNMTTFDQMLRGPAYPQDPGDLFSRFRGLVSEEAVNETAPTPP